MISYKPYTGSHSLSFPENPVNELIIKVLKMRQWLLENKKGRHDEQMHLRTGRIIQQFTSVPNRTSVGCVKFYEMHHEDIMYILPGKKSVSYAQMQTLVEKCDNWKAEIMANYYQTGKP